MTYGSHQRSRSNQKDTLIEGDDLCHRSIVATHPNEGLVAGANAAAEATQRAAQKVFMVRKLCRRRGGQPPTHIDQAHQRHSSPRRGVPPTTYELNVRVRDEPAERGYRFDPLGSIDALIQDVVVLHMLAVVSLFSLQIHP